MVSEGYLEAGYTQVNIDDCWFTLERDPVTDEQVADPDRFPGGIKALSKYMHDKGLKLGLYSDIGTKTCGGYIGMQDHLELDANTFASWDIDMLKVDGCYQDTDMMSDTYPELSRALNATGRPIVYSCSWPAYLDPDYGEADDAAVLKELAQICHLWRNWDDIEDSWASVSSVIDFWKRNSTDDPFVAVAGPGHWNDPDQLMIGDNGLSIFEERSQFALWAIFAAPLIMSNDIIAHCEDKVWVVPARAYCAAATRHIEDLAVLLITWRACGARPKFGGREEGIFVGAGPSPRTHRDTPPPGPRPGPMPWLMYLENRSACTAKRRKASVFVQVGKVFSGSLKMFFPCALCSSTAGSAAPPSTHQRAGALRRVSKVLQVLESELRSRTRQKWKTPRRQSVFRLVIDAIAVPDLVLEIFRELKAFETAGTTGEGKLGKGGGGGGTGGAGTDSGSLSASDCAW